MAPRTDFPPVRACLFDMDGLLLNSEDLYTICTNKVLHKYGRPDLPWSIKARLQGRPGPASGAIFSAWAQLPISREEYMAELAELQKQHFPDCVPLPGAEGLLHGLARTRNTERFGERKGKTHIALATSSHKRNYELKTGHLKELFEVFPESRRVLGDDERIGAGRGKPAPDIYLLALQTINASLEEGEKEVKPEECLVFEDSVPGVEAGRRAGMRVVWVPHPGLLEEYKGREEEVLAGRTGEAGEVDMHQVGEVGDGWAELLGSLEELDLEKYGIVIPPKEEGSKI